MEASVNKSLLPVRDDKFKLLAFTLENVFVEPVKVLLAINLGKSVSIYKLLVIFLEASVNKSLLPVKEDKFKLLAFTLENVFVVPVKILLAINLGKSVSIYKLLITFLEASVNKSLLPVKELTFKLLIFIFEDQEVAPAPLVVNIWLFVPLPLGKVKLLSLLLNWFEIGTELL